MVAVQLVSARIGRVTGRGLAANLAEVFPRPAVAGLVALLFIANTINIGADLAAMGAAAKLVLGVDQDLGTLAFAALCLILQVFVPYHAYVKFLKWLTLSLFAYVGVVFTVQIDWAEVLVRVVMPKVELSAALLTTVVAVFGTTISPYLFFWQSAEEVEEMGVRNGKDLLHETPELARQELRRIRLDTFLGMGLSNLVAFFIILTAAETLFTAGFHQIETSAQAALALRPIAGPLAFILFSLGIIGTGLLAVPVLAGSSAYAVCELTGWRAGLEKKPAEAPAFYGVILAGIGLALGVIASPLDPIRTLYWSAVVNGVISIPIMAAMLVVAGRQAAMGRYVATRPQLLFGWLATAVMALAVLAMFVFAGT